MNKREWIWIGIRIFGIYLLVQAVTAIPSVLSSALMLHTFSNFQAVAADTEGKLRNSLLTGARAELTRSLSQFIICGAFAIYFLRHGALLFRWMNRTEDIETKANHEA